MRPALTSNVSPPLVVPRPSERDGYPSDPEDIFLPAGASAGVSLILNVLITPNVTGVLIPIPQYPLYTATLAQFSGVPLPYHLSEPDN